MAVEASLTVRGNGFSTSTRLSLATAIKPEQPHLELVIEGVRVLLASEDAARLAAALEMALASTVLDR